VVKNALTIGRNPENMPIFQDVNLSNKPKSLSQKQTYFNTWSRGKQLWNSRNHGQFQHGDMASISMMFG
jgi:hypothetical protein